MGKNHIHKNLSSSTSSQKTLKNYEKNFEPSSKKFNVAARTSVEKNTRKNLVHPLPDGDLNKKKIDQNHGPKTHTQESHFIHFQPENLEKL